MKLGPRTRKRGIVDKILTRKRETVARMRAAPPLPSRSSPRGGALELLGSTSLVVVPCDAAMGGEGYERLFERRGELSSEDPAARILALDFVIHPVQLERARSSGADAVVLVARLVSDELLGSLCERARALGLEIVVEVCSPEELERAIAHQAGAVAVSLRDRDHGRLDESAARTLLGLARPRARTLLLSVPSDWTGDAFDADHIVHDSSGAPGEGTSALVPGAEPA